MKFVDKYSSARPYIACFVLLQKDRKIAMILRKNTGYMDGYYGLPCGKVEYGEHFTQAAVREAKEEAGVSLELKNLQFIHAVHRHGEEDGGFMDWVDVYFMASSWKGEPYNAEPEKSERLDWLDLDSLPDNIVPPQREVLQYIAQGIAYSEYGWEEK